MSGAHKAPGMQSPPLDPSALTGAWEPTRNGSPGTFDFALPLVPTCLPVLRLVPMRGAPLGYGVRSAMLGDDLYPVPDPTPGTPRAAEPGLDEVQAAALVFLSHRLSHVIVAVVANVPDHLLPVDADVDPDDA